MNDEVEDVEQNYKDDFLTTIAEKLGAAAKASLVFGEPVERDGVTVIPVAKSRWASVAARAKQNTSTDLEAVAEL